MEEATRWRPILDGVPLSVVGQPHDVGKILQVGVDPVRVEKFPPALKVMEASVINSGVPEDAEVWHRVGSCKARSFKNKNMRIKRPRSLHVRKGPASGDKLPVDELLAVVLPGPPMKPEGGSRWEEPHPASAIDEPTLGTEEATELLSRPSGQCGREGERPIRVGAR